MNSVATAFVVLNSIVLLFLSRRLAPLPLLVGACYMTLGQGLELGSFTFTVIRILVAAGLVRVVIRGERISGGMNSLDRLMIVWAIWALISSAFHDDPSGALVFRLGLVYNTCGIYFLLRVFCRSFEDVMELCRITALLLVPIAVEMVYETLTLHNLFSVFEGVPESPAIREGRARAQGPFAHSILAGTVGAASLPLMCGLWRQNRKTAILGGLASATMIFASGSSGPIVSAAAGVGAMLMWYHRDKMRLFRWLTLLAYIGLDLVMKAPAYYIIGRINLVGGSTGYHRAALIEAALRHLHEWWLAGTDYTRHWMPTGVSWDAGHTDITNHYIQLGVIGGLPLMLLFIAILAKGFSFVGLTLRQGREFDPESQFVVWALGAALFAHAATFISVSYFDQSFVFIYLNLAAIGSVYAVRIGKESFSDARVESGDKVLISTGYQVRHLER